MKKAPVDPAMKREPQLLRKVTVLRRVCVLIISYHAAPSGSPQNVVATALSSTEIEVSWEEVPAIDRNGEIIMYKIKYEPLDCGLMVENINTTTPVLMMNLTGLEEYVEYNITVRAYTSEGPGPYSDPPVTERTLEDGMRKPCYLSVILHSMFHSSS